MKLTSTIALAASLSLTSAHTIFQKLSVNGVEKGLLEGVRAPTSNNPIENVNHADFACNFGLASPVNQQVVTVPAGAKVGTWWQHLLGQNQAGDSENPIALSHKGPIQVYIAKVVDAATADGKTAKWTKIASDGLDTSTGLWAVDKLYSNNGWYEFTMPSCVAPGEYLMRAELLALHSAGGKNGAQFYQSCANIRVTGSGTTSLSGGVSFPGAYSPTDPGILISIYGPNGQSDNGRKAYTAPGPAVMTCPAGGNGGGAAPTVTPTPTPKPVSTTKTAVPTTMVTAVKPVSSTKAAVPTSTPTPAPETPVNPPVAGGAPLYGQCGGNGFTGPRTCAVGACKHKNDWYSQCLPVEVRATTAGAPLYAQCGGQGFTGEKKCGEGFCKVLNDYYSQCLH